MTVPMHSIPIDDPGRLGLGQHPAARPATSAPPTPARAEAVQAQHPARRAGPAPDPGRPAAHSIRGSTPHMTRDRPRAVLAARAALLGAVRNMICLTAYAAGVDPIGLAMLVAANTRAWGDDLLEQRDLRDRQAALRAERARPA